LTQPKSREKPIAVVQLRQDNLAGSLYNLVGFQTNLTNPEQRRVFRMVPGLEKAEFVRYGQMHRNTFIFAPEHLEPTLQSRKRNDLFFAGQITGVEGYVGNIATGLLAGINAARLYHQLDPLILPRTTMSGALCHYISHSNPVDFQPMKANFGILPPPDSSVRGKRERAKALSDKALRDLEPYLHY
jgi:methylenetetrahydrofolate--tRNA-(uracil-5-)-methyltransferase